MPRFVETRPNGSEKRLDQNIAINMPMQRFRAIAGCVSWTSRRGTAAIRDGIIMLMTSEGHDPRITNSTLGFGRDLTLEEQAVVREKNVGQFLANAGARAVADEIREAKQQKIDRILQAASKKQRAKVIGPHDEEQEVQIAHSEPPSKRRRKYNGDTLPLVDEASLTEAGQTSVNSSDRLTPAFYDDRDVQLSTGSKMGYYNTLPPWAEELQFHRRQMKGLSGDQQGCGSPDLTHSCGEDQIFRQIDDSTSPPNLHQAEKALKDVHRGQPPHQPSTGTDQLYLPPQQHPGEVFAEQVAKIMDREKHAALEVQSSNDHEGSHGPGSSVGLGKSDHASPFDESDLLLDWDSTINFDGSSADDYVDYGQIAPQNMAECKSIERALADTREGYLLFTSQEAPLTDQRQSYMEQWTFLHDSYKTFAEKEPDDDFIYLYRLDAWNWNGSLLTWEHPPDLLA